MKRKMFITISAIILLVTTFLTYRYHDKMCNMVGCGTKMKLDNKASACNSCGKNSCNKSCSSNDTNNLKALVPSCNLSNSEMEKRKEFLQSTIAKKIYKAIELENGYDLIFHEPIEYSKELLEFINFERGCCASFSFALIFEPNNSATHLQMYGSKEIKEELRRGFIKVGFLKVAK